jgi:hypothetical protein
MRRREFITLLGGAAAAWPRAAAGNIGRWTDGFSDRVRAFRQGLKEAG